MNQELLDIKTKVERCFSNQDDIKLVMAFVEVAFARGVTKGMEEISEIINPKDEISKHQDIGVII